MAIEVSGTEIILRDLEKMVPSDMDIDDALRAGAEPIHRRMVAGAPVKTGRMKRSIKIGEVRPGKTGRVITIGVHRRDFGPGVYYPAYVEYGHGGPRPAPPHPFVRTAYDLGKEEAYAALKQAVIDQLKQKGL